ncbi:sigma factor-like helix-turn-helix DNA-binding protein [Nonomuraea dietziae]|uniref:sigma factor-like helix-turn-helix DNA-binding protein n=1 Tax=Nonomuraea dietziae TaxID=65515 RepID=UPI0031E46560
MWETLAGLPRKQRVVLVLRYYEGLRDEEIAAALRSLAEPCGARRAGARQAPLRGGRAHRGRRHVGSRGAAMNGIEERLSRTLGHAARAGATAGRPGGGAAGDRFTGDAGTGPRR